MADSSFRIIFMGTPDFAVPALHQLLNGPDRDSGRGHPA